MISKTSNINLIQTHKTFLERFINWALTLGRIVVIVTEGIALGAFLFRFSLDRQIIDLHGQIKQKQAVLAYLKDNEKAFRNIQDRLTEVKKLGSKTPASLSVFNDIVTSLPTGIVLSNFNISNTTIQIEASTNSIQSLSSFVTTLQSNKKINSISLDKIQNLSANSVIAFGISIQLQQ
jgi:polyhydroxyalkanoate synthesis regulator protein